MPKCWFCEENPAIPELAFKVKFHDGGTLVRTTGRERVYEYKWTEVGVPTCRDCVSNKASAERRNYIAGAAFILPIVAGFIINSIFPDMGTIYKYAFPCGGAILGLILGLVIAMRLGEPESNIKPANSILEYPGVVEMIKSPFWHIDDIWQSELDKS
jgi:hypothetical protein